MIAVVGAVLIENGRILAAQRPDGARLGGLWEFPGGKVEPDESPKEALVREIREELGCEVSVGDALATTEHRYDFGTISLQTFYCRLLTGTPMASEHQALRWLTVDEFASVTWAPADLPALERVIQDLRRSEAR